MQFSLSPDIRTKQDAITFHGKHYPYSIHFSKNRSRINIQWQQDESLKVDAPTGTQNNVIEEYIRTFIESNLKLKEEKSQEGSHEIIQGIIRIKEFEIPYRVSINSRIKLPRITTFQGGIFQVEVPGPISREEVIRILKNGEDWLYREYYKSLPECPPDTEHQIVNILNTPVSYIIRRNSRIKRTKIRILGNGTIEVLAPFDARTEKIALFVHNNIDWIAPKIGLKPLKTKQPKEEKRKFNENQDNNSVSIEYKGHTISYLIARSRRAKRLTIKIDRNKNVQIVCPLQARLSDISSFMNQKADWIYAHTVASSRPLPPRREYHDGEIWPFLGDTITIRIIKGEKPAYHREGKELFITIPVDFIEYQEKELIKQVITSFFSKSLYQFSLPWFRIYGSNLGVNVPQIKIRDQKTKWGACSAYSIILNLRLCMAPPEIIEYVIAHEISHKVHPNHSPRFWSTVEKIMPDYRMRKEDLKKNGYAWVL